MNGEAVIGHTFLYHHRTVLQIGSIWKTHFPTQFWQDHGAKINKVKKSSRNRWQCEFAGQWALLSSVKKACFLRVTITSWTSRKSSETLSLWPILDSDTPLVAFWCIFLTASTREIAIICGRCALTEKTLGLFLSIDTSCCFSIVQKSRCHLSAAKCVLWLSPSHPIDRFLTAQSSCVCYFYVVVMLFLKDASQSTWIGKSKYSWYLHFWEVTLQQKHEFSN